jgi:CheY-like chemotaxis protein
MGKIFDGKKILLVEDDLFLGGMLGHKFLDLGAKVLGAKSGAEAIEIAKKEFPDIILLDILLPEVNGFDVLKTLKEDENTKRIPVLILSNLSQKSDIDKCKELGAEKFLVKATVDLNEIAEEVRKILNINIDKSV